MHRRTHGYTIAPSYLIKIYTEAQLFMLIAKYNADL